MVAQAISLYKERETQRQIMGGESIFSSSLWRNKVVIKDFVPQGSLKNKIQRKTGNGGEWWKCPFPREGIIMGILSLFSPGIFKERGA